MKTTSANILILSVSLTTAFGCVSAGKYDRLEDENNQNKASLAKTEARVSELESKLGITQTQRSELESSVKEMKTALEELQKRRAESEKRLAEYRELTNRFKRMVDAGKLSVKVVDGRMLLALSSDILFPSGSARLSPQGLLAIKEVTAVLKDLGDRNFQVEGHTDNVPIRSATFPSNWELAAARAMTVLKTTLEAGMPAERISAASLGETRPVADNSTDEGRAANRRIEIVVMPDLTGLPGFNELNNLAEGA